MEKILEGAKFGDKFKTRDGRRAIYICRPSEDVAHRLIIEGRMSYDCFNDYGRNWVTESDIDIIEKLDVPEVEEVVINNKIDPITFLYHKDIKIGDIENATALNDILAQIRIKKDNGEDTTGYYIMWGEQKIEILPSGKIPQPPIGFYDSSAKSLRTIYGL